MFVNRRQAQKDNPGIEHIDGLYSYAMIVTQDLTEAEALVQETYVRAIPAIGRRRPGSNVKVWLFTILRNVWSNQLRHRRGRPLLIEIDEGAATLVAEAPQEPHALYTIKAEREQVREAIRKLPVECREIVMLRQYEGLSYQEIANILDCPLGP
jgi:RNA polymerase sigma-70 factor (ECF subfamily)